MSRRNPKAGEGPCPTCGRGVFFRRNASGKLTYSCEACDSSGYADANGRADRQWTASMTSTEEVEPTPVQAVKPAGKPAPAAPRKPGAFSMDALMGAGR